VFGVASDPVKLGLVASFPRPGGNATGIDILGSELAAKRLALLHDLVPKAVRIAVLVNPANRDNAETTLRSVEEAARGLGLRVRALNANNSREIDAAFVTIEKERFDALFVAPDAFFWAWRAARAFHGLTEAYPALAK
jgi:putative tryptophan/tyrosine transport system substrate-binding protein